MVPFFVDGNPYANGIVPNINTLATALRAAGGCVAWVLPAPSPTAAMEEFLGRTSRSRTEDAPRDIFVEKSAASAFFPDTCDLGAQRDRRSVDTVMVEGTVANVCCEFTARDPSTLGSRTITVADANAAQRDHDLDSTLDTSYRSFGDVRPTVELVHLLG